MADRYEPRHVAGGMPADCCEFGVVDLSAGIEICRVWTADNARRISRRLSDAEDPCKPIEDAVLRVLPGRVQHPVFGSEFYHSLDRIASAAGIDKEAARFGCRRLRNKGLAAYRSGLFDEDGLPAGSGYALTAAGVLAAVSADD